MRLTVPEPKIELYKDGFAKHDQLNRKETGDKLSGLVERIDDPLVIALDGAWGSGKSFFLKCWVGEHLKRPGNTTQTVYFDAFQHDFLDDPLIALTGAIAERFRDPEAEKQETDQAKASARRSKLKKSAWAVSKAAGRIGLSAVTFGATEILSGMGDEIAKAASDEAKAFLSSDAGDDEAEKFWNAHDARIAAMEAFRLALTELTEPDDAGEPQRKLVIVIDELDRCRPDYALSLLEIIKHFFSVDGVHFVLGVNLTELQNSVRARYGSGVDAAKYLQKFISITAPLRGSKPRNRHSSIITKHFDYVASELGAMHTWQYDWLRDYLVVVDHHVDLSLRDVEKIGALIQVCPTSYLRHDGHLHLFSSLTILSVAAPSLFKKARSGELTYGEVQSIFDFPSPSNFHDHMEYAAVCWKLATKRRSGEQIPMNYFDQSERLFQKLSPQDELRNIISNCFYTFRLPSE
ncbi:KAP family P-loop NTPase fold protein [Leisingera sp. ANG-M7]|uniref:KAP family P-loop NTPase fold protein n=1 Tax=Leisingera sp. ANG-M7 TaxID=1577902 RepID=UPI00057F1531|nr:P-loop NTPase fold protein [Leisingera sp. ANG-M7]KIC38289.1 hypothetical protein RA26_04820 [Leisingera sp. ANG-M7]